MSRESKATKEEIQRNRDEAYQNGWGDGYAEGYGKATKDAIRALPAAPAEDARAGALAVANALDAWAEAQRQGRYAHASITGLRDMAKVVRALIPGAKP